jgi:hypothetical protein
MKRLAFVIAAILLLSPLTATACHHDEGKTQTSAPVKDIDIEEEVYQL